MSCLSEDLKSKAIEDLEDDRLLELHKLLHDKKDEAKNSSDSVFKRLVAAHFVVHQEISKRDLAVDVVDDLDDEATPVWITAKATFTIQKSENEETPLTWQPITKKEVADDKQIILGQVLIPETEDAHGDVVSAEEIEKAAHLWLARKQHRGEMHKKIVNDKVEIYESYIAPEDLTIEGQKVKKGTWLLMLHVLDSEIWSKIKSGEFAGLSMGGYAKRKKVK